MRIGVFNTSRVVYWVWTAKCKAARNAKDVWPNGNYEVRTAKCAKKWGGEPRSTKYEVCNAVESGAENRGVRNKKCATRWRVGRRTAKYEVRSAD